MLILPSRVSAVSTGPDFTDLGFHVLGIGTVAAAGIAAVNPRAVQILSEGATHNLHGRHLRPNAHFEPL
jgi:hypothetical protein